MSVPEIAGRIDELLGAAEQVKRVVPGTLPKHEQSDVFGSAASLPGGRSPDPTAWKLTFLLA